MFLILPLGVLAGLCRDARRLCLEPVVWVLIFVLIIGPAALIGGVIGGRTARPRRQTWRLPQGDPQLPASEPGRDQEMSQEQNELPMDPDRRE